MQNNSHRPLMEQQLASFIGKLAQEKQARAAVLFNGYGTARNAFRASTHYALDHGLELDYIQMTMRKGPITIRFYAVTPGNIMDMSGLQFSHAISKEGSIQENLMNTLAARVRAPSCEEYTLPVGWYFLGEV